MLFSKYNDTPQPIALMPLALIVIALSAMTGCTHSPNDHYPPDPLCVMPSSDDSSSDAANVFTPERSPSDVDPHNHSNETDSPANPPVQPDPSEPSNEPVSHCRTRNTGSMPCLSDLIDPADRPTPTALGDCVEPNALGLQWLQADVPVGCLNLTYDFVESSPDTIAGHLSLAFNGEGEFDGVTFPQAGSHFRWHSGRNPETGRGVLVATFQMQFSIPAAQLPQAGYPKVLATIADRGPYGTPAWGEGRQGEHIAFGVELQTHNNVPSITVFSEAMAPVFGQDDGPTSNSPHVRLPAPVNGVYTVTLEIVFVRAQGSNQATFHIATGNGGLGNDANGNPSKRTWALNGFADNNPLLWLTVGTPIGDAWRHNLDKTTAIGVVVHDLSLHVKWGVPTEQLMIQLPQTLHDHCRGVTTPSREHMFGNRPNAHMQWVPRTQWMDGFPQKLGENDDADGDHTNVTSAIIAHHTDSEASSGGYQHCVDAVRAIYIHHANIGYRDIGYTYLVCESWVFQGRETDNSDTCDWRNPESTPGACSFYGSIDNIGAHAYGYNGGWTNSQAQSVSSVGVALIADLENRSPSDHEFWTYTCVMAVAAHYASIPAEQFAPDVRATSSGNPPAGFTNDTNASRASARNQAGQIVGVDLAGFAPHRAVNSTVCPGSIASGNNNGFDATFNVWIMERVRALLSGSGNFNRP